MNERIGLDQLDRQVGEWLRDEAWGQAPAALVEDVFARTTRARQVRRWPIALPWTGDGAGDGDRPRSRRLVTGLAGAVAVALVVVTISLVLRPGWLGPAATPVPSSTATPSPSPTASGPSGPPVPVPTTLGTYDATSLSLGGLAAPIAVTEAFGSIWVAILDASEVRRYDPATMEEIKRIPVHGPGWFAEAGGALWVTHHGGRGLARIDPATNTVGAEVGADTPCGAPFVALDSLWQAACDGGVILRIDPTANRLADRIPAAGYQLLVDAGGRLVTNGPDGLASLDPATGAITAIGYPGSVGAGAIVSDGDTVWVVGTTEVTRVDPSTGGTLATFDIVGTRGISFADGSAWLTVAGDGVVEIDLASNSIRRTIPVPGAPGVTFVTGNTLWATDLNGNLLWRVDLSSG